MGKSKIIFGYLLLLVVLSSPLFIRPQQVSAAACPDIASFGAVTVSLPTLPRVGEYTAWVRMQAPDTENSRLLLEVNGKSCFELGGANLTPKQWQWVSTLEGNEKTRSLHEFKQATGNTAKVIGTHAGVRVDRVILVRGDCVPVEVGDNCSTSAQASAQNQRLSSATAVPPLIQSAVTGKVVPSQTLLREANNVSQVSYSIKNQTLQISEGPAAFDTTLVANGKHSLEIEIITKDGRTLKEVTTLEVNNPEGIFAPLKRWLRQNKQPLTLGLIVLVGVLLVSTTWFIARHTHHKRRQLRFHGF